MQVAAFFLLTHDGLSGARPRVSVSPLLRVRSIQGITTFSAVTQTVTLRRKLASRRRSMKHNSLIQLLNVRALTFVVAFSVCAQSGATLKTADSEASRLVYADFQNPINGRPV